MHPKPSDLHRFEYALQSAFVFKYSASASLQALVAHLRLSLAVAVQKLPAESLTPLQNAIAPLAGVS